MGIERTFTARARIEIAVLGDRCKIQPYGLNGGLPGKSSEYAIMRANGDLVILESKDATVYECGRQTDNSHTRVGEDLANRNIASLHSSGTILKITASQVQRPRKYITMRKIESLFKT